MEKVGFEGRVRAAMLRAFPGVQAIAGGYHFRRMPGTSEAYYMDAAARELAGASVLDVGCGFGIFLAYLAELGYEKIAGADASLEYVIAARAIMRDLGVDCPIMQWDVRNPFEYVQRYDAVTAFEFLYEMPEADLENALCNLAGFVRPGGMLVFTLLESENAKKETRTYWGVADVARFASAHAWKLCSATAHKSLTHSDVMYLVEVQP